MLQLEDVPVALRRARRAVRGHADGVDQPLERHLRELRLARRRMPHVPRQLVEGRAVDGLGADEVPDVDEDDGLDDILGVVPSSGNVRGWVVGLRPPGWR